jgi:hypothetical protein
VAQSNLPTVQRFKYEDYADAKDWQTALQQFIASVNLFAEPVYSLLNGRVTYQNLTVPKLYTQNITGATPTIFNFVNPLSILPSAVMLGNVYVFPNFNVHPTVVVQPMWHCTDNVIFIDDVIGLTPGVKYSLTLVVM